MNSFVVAAIGKWNLEYFHQFSTEHQGNWYFASNPDELNKVLETVNPVYIFFPHWSWIVPREIVEKYECVCFHMTDLPFGRGGSPLQNLITRGITETVLTALRMDEGVDTGPIYCKKPLDLRGTAFDIYKRAGRISWEIINGFIESPPEATPQTGKPIVFKRRTPEQSQMPNNATPEDLYDYIRMLDAPGYPKAFIKTKDYILEFKEASYNDGVLTAKVDFISKKDRK